MQNKPSLTVRAFIWVLILAGILMLILVAMKYRNGTLFPPKATLNPRSHLVLKMSSHLVLKPEIHLVLNLLRFLG